nr:MAG: hypothetical protein [Lactococcus phage NR01]
MTKLRKNQVALVVGLKKDYKLRGMKIEFI